ncbi:hypothetical protein [Elstera cyanobacteriorum]|uniref:hypothetical protein n=1 Tax=Elstera cyanobacteriorum TaxID=2022747 RepID=UPI00113FE005|nr:hypothetical protein [Elstera cyanobacteriorum]
MEKKWDKSGGLSSDSVQDSAGRRIFLPRRGGGGDHAGFPRIHTKIFFYLKESYRVFFVLSGIKRAAYGKTADPMRPGCAILPIELGGSAGFLPLGANPWAGRVDILKP